MRWMTPAQWCCIWLIVLGILLSGMDLLSWSLTSDEPSTFRPRGRGPFVERIAWKWGLGCTVCGVLMLLALEVTGRPRGEGEP
jgi:hypothetical protein